YLFTTGAFLMLAAGPLGRGRAYAETADPQGPEVLARGPVHEAFAQPPDGGSPGAGAVVPRQPPQPIEELPPDPKPEGGDAQWIPGYWQWDGERNDFVWVSGTWREAPPGRQWVPGSWRKVGDGWQWVSGFWADAGQPGQAGEADPAGPTYEYQPPPPATLETGPSAPAPGDDYFYDPGCWVYRATRYPWRPGCRLRFPPGFVWTPCRSRCTRAGCVFVRGSGASPREQRGLLCAPAYFPPDLLASGAGPWTPSYVIGADVLPGTLFVQPGFRHYSFGDYYGPRYLRA